MAQNVYIAHEYTERMEGAFISPGYVVQWCVFVFTSERPVLLLIFWAWQGACTSREFPHSVPGHLIDAAPMPPQILQYPNDHEHPHHNLHPGIFLSSVSKSRMNFGS